MQSLTRGTLLYQRKNWKITYSLRTLYDTYNEFVPLTKSYHNPSVTSVTALVDDLLQHTSTLVNLKNSNFIAFSGGVDSSLVATLLYRIFHEHDSTSGEVRAIIGISPSLPPHQLNIAKYIAEEIGISLTEVPTMEVDDSSYVENTGSACFVCKNHLYSALNAVTSYTRTHKRAILFNGTNADDLLDKTRVGLLAARSFRVKSPLYGVTKTQIRQAAKHLGLSNWNHAASPCLRSRLALGVKATSTILQVVDMVEMLIRTLLDINVTYNLRVRLLAGRCVIVELDDVLFADNDSNDMEILLKQLGVELLIHELGFIGGFGVRTFKSGSNSV